MENLKNDHYPNVVWALETLFPKNKNKNADHNICKEVSLQFLNRFRYSLEQI